MTLFFLLIQLFVPFVLPQTANDPCGCEDNPQVNILAVVDGVKITKKDLGSDVQNRVSVLQNEVIKARSEQLDLLINSYLLDAEAKRRGQTAQELLQTDVIDKVPKPTDAEAEIFYKQRKERMVQDFKTVKPQIITFLRSEREQAALSNLVAMLRASANVKILVDNITTPTNEQDLDRVFATAAGRKFTSRNVEEALAPLIFQVRQETYQLRKDDLDRRINDMLLEEEAKRQNLTPLQVLSKVVRAQIPIITNQQARAFYDQNKSKIKDDFEKVKFQIIDYLTKTEEDKLTKAFAAELRKNSAIQIYLTPPEPLTLAISIDDQPLRGNPKAKVTVIEFTDFECPSCALVQKDLDKFVAEFGERVAFVARDYPLNRHEQAIGAAEAAEAAREQGKYWEFASLLYANQSALSNDDLKRYATQLGLDRAKFDAAVDGRKFRARVQRDIDDGKKLGINSTPTIFVNGRQVTELSYAAIKTAIENALKRTK